ncbi:MAG: hypothetical protein IJM54_09940 [Thermoguttaceae bacterium]|nr:hypothetical protein [Thermoguttaceae bacterium]
MAKTNVFIPNLSGSAVPLDNKQFDIKFTKSVEQLNSGLSKAQKALKLYYNSQQELSDSIGRCVEGLSLWQVRLGMWVDETGKARTVAGQYAEGLNKTELELGYYADELGNVHKKTGEIIRQTQSAIQAEKERQESLHRTREALADAFDAIGDGTGRFASLLAQLEDSNVEVKSLRQEFARVAGTINVASQTFSTVQNIATWLKEANAAALAFKTSLASSATAAQGLKAVIASLGGPYTALAGVAISAGSALLAFNAAAKETKNLSLEESVGSSAAEAFKELAKRAKEAGEEIRGVADVLKYGAFYTEDAFDLRKTGEQIDELNKKIESLETERSKAAEAAREVMKNAGMSGASAGAGAYAKADKLAKQIQDAKSELEPLQAKYNEIATELVKQAREEQKTEEQKAEELKRQYQNILQYTKNLDDRAVLEKKIRSIDEGIAEKKAKERADLEKRLADQRDALARDLGISLDFSDVRTNEELLAKALEELRADLKGDELAEAEKRLAQEFSVPGLREALEELRADLKGDELAEAEKRLAQEFSVPGLRESLEKLRANFKDDGSGLIKTRDELAEAEKRLWEKRVDSYFSDLLANATTTSDVESLRKSLAEKQELTFIGETEYQKLLERATAKEAELLAAQIDAIPGLKALIDANEAAKNAVDYQKKALENAANYFHDDLLNAFSKEQFDFLNVNPDLLDASMKDYVDALAAAAEGLKKNAIDRETYDELVKRANKNLADATDEAAKKLKADVRSELGIDALMESLKSPLQKFDETIAKASKALEFEQITGEEFIAIKKKLEEDLLNQNKEIGDVREKFEKEKEREKKSDSAPAKSLEAGSTDMYLAQIRSSQSYQSKVLDATEKLRSAMRESLDETRQTNFYLSELLAANSSADYPSWG